MEDLQVESELDSQVTNGGTLGSAGNASIMYVAILNFSTCVDPSLCHQHDRCDTVEAYKSDVRRDPSSAQGSGDPIPPMVLADSTSSTLVALYSPLTPPSMAILNSEVMCVDLGSSHAHEDPSPQLCAKTNTPLKPPIQTTPVPTPPIFTRPLLQKQPPLNEATTIVIDDDHDDDEMETLSWCVQ